MFTKFVIIYSLLFIPNAVILIRFIKTKISSKETIIVRHQPGLMYLMISVGAIALLASLSNMYSKLIDSIPDEDWFFEVLTLICYVVSLWVCNYLQERIVLNSDNCLEMYYCSKLIFTKKETIRINQITRINVSDDFDVFVGVRRFRFVNVCLMGTDELKDLLGKTKCFDRENMVVIECL